MSSIFRKTAKGVHEIETRAHGLPLRVRNVLILVDGRRDVAALRGLVPQQVDDMLSMLVEQAFIEAAGHAAPTPAPRAADDARIEAPVPPVAVSSAPLQPFNVRQRAAVRDLNDAIGPMAEALAIRMERARHDADLRTLVQTAVQMIGNARGRSVAEAYAKRHAG